MPSVLFVCTANQFRSPLAAACFNQILDQAGQLPSWCVESAGTWTIPDLPATSQAIRIADHLDLPGLAAHRTRQVDQELLDRFDLILVMEIGHLEALASEFPSACDRLNLLSEVADGSPYSILDPFDQNTDPEEVAAELVALIQNGSRHIIDLAERLHASNHPPLPPGEGQG